MTSFALLLCWMLTVGWAQEPEVVLPTVVYAAPPVYPAEALAAGEGAVVTLQIEVDEAGFVVDAVALDASTEAFAQAAEDALAAYRFTPATVDGEPVAVTVTYALTFDAEVLPVPAVEGRVFEAGVRTPLEGVTLELTRDGRPPAYAVSDADGAFTFYDLEPGTWTVTAIGRGLRPEPVDVEVTAGRVVEVKLYPRQDRPWEEQEADIEIEVVSQFTPPEVTERRIDAKTAMAQPGTNGNLLRAVLNFPGVARPPLGIAAFVIRGTEPEATKFYVDGVRLPQVFHFGGLATVLNGDILDEVRFLTGNFGVRYGDGYGGVVDLVTSPVLPERSNGYVSIDVYQAAIFVEQRLPDDWSISVSGRRSYADAVLGPILERFQSILNRIAEKIPGINKIDTEKTNDGRLLLRFNDKGFQDPFYSQQMSDGTLKVFAYLLLLEDPTPPPFLCMEEPENGLYHKLLESLATEFREHSTGRKGGSQVFITTHQPYLVDALEPAEVWILEKGSDGYSVIHRASDYSIVKNMVAEGLPLGGLWYSDYLDAR